MWVLGIRVRHPEGGVGSKSRYHLVHRASRGRCQSINTSYCLFQGVMKYGSTA